MSENAIEELRRLYEAGTPGVWSREPCREHREMANQGLSCDRIRSGQSNIYTHACPDADLIVAMHRHLPALLAVCEAALAVSRGSCDMGEHTSVDTESFDAMEEALYTLLQPEKETT